MSRLLLIEIGIGNFLSNFKLINLFLVVKVWKEVKKIEIFNALSAVYVQYSNLQSGFSLVHYLFLMNTILILIPFQSFY